MIPANFCSCVQSPREIAGFGVSEPMANRPKYPCRHGACAALLDYPGYCEKHARSWEKRADSPKRITGRRLQKMREQLFRDHPLCAECLRHGRITPATQRDHIVPLTEGGTDDTSNEQGLCDDCHEVKSQREALRARTRRGG